MELAALGPFFAVELADQTEGWSPLRDLLDPGVLDARVDHVTRFLSRLSGSEVEERVAASTYSLGLFARLVAPALGAAATGIALPRLTFDATFWQPVESGPMPLLLTGAPAAPDLDLTIEQVVLPLADLIGARYSLSDPIIRGNVMSGVFGAVTMIGTAAPSHREAARVLATSLLDGRLAGSGTLAPSFVRSSCCLYYRVPGGGYCGDCVLAAR